jgi:polysaccharide deacetylase family protein (PEP-CTERM system associated)
MSATLIDGRGESADMVPQRAHIMSVDVEDYFMVEAFADSIPRAMWESCPSRIVTNTRRVLDLFNEYGVRGTFFFVGWLAKRYPELVRDVQACGHELACHSFWHRPVYSLNPDEFRKDTRAAVCAIEDAAGKKVYGYRAPSWSITKECLWALDILAEEGFTYDSSIYPIHHDLYGIPGAQRFPYQHRLRDGRSLLEFPPTTARLWGQNLPGAGGGYLRILPLAYTRWIFRQVDKECREKVVVYFHPWELDPEQPRVKDKWKSRIRHYTNLHKMKDRVESLLASYSFQPIGESIESRDVAEELPIFESAATGP